MKLISKISLQLSTILLVVFTAWALFFYYAIIDEINDEVDDALELYAEQLIIKTLAGEPLPTENDGSNNFYSIVKLEQTEHLYGHIHYADTMIFIEEKNEMEPARFLQTIFKDENEDYYKLDVFTPTIEKADLRESILIWIVILYGILLVTILLVNILIYYRSLKPLHVLLRWLDHYRIGGKNKPLDNKTNITEFKKINEAAVRYAERAEYAFEHQKQFIGNASHEIQTPLAICINRLELLLNDPTLTEAQMTELVKTQQTLSHIVKLNKALLFISKIDNQQFPEVTRIDFNELIKKQLEDFSSAYSYLNIEIDIHESATLHAEMNPDLALALINNLLKNAFVHNIPSGKIEIRIDADSLTIKNNGNNESLDPDKIFERFYQGGKKEGSTGLGLAVVDAICRMYHIQHKYEFCNEKHCFELRFSTSSKK